jgi:hypothetical protein
MDGTNCIDNDDALVDCVAYANEVRMGRTPDGIPARRPISGAPERSDSMCSISMCGNDDDPSCRLVRYCENGHFVHDRCIEYMIMESDTLSTTTCPQCRSNRVMVAVVNANPIHDSILRLNFGTDEMAERAIRSVVPEIGGACLLPTLLKGEELSRKIS